MIIIKTIKKVTNSYSYFQFILLFLKLGFDEVIFLIEKSKGLKIILVLK